MAKEPTREKALGDGWEEHARHDPLWAILSRDDKRGREWDIDEFFTVGAYDVDRIIKELADQGIRPQTASALDFGCGVGRLTQALVDHFDHVVGVDVSPTMIGLSILIARRGASCSRTPAHSTRKTKGAELPSITGTSGPSISTRALSMPHPAKAAIKCSTVATRAP